MSKNLESPTKLTEFAPLQQEERPQSVGQFISRILKFGKTEDQASPEGKTSQESVPTWAEETPQGSGNIVPNIYPVDVNEGRSLQNVLKRISNLLALKSNNLQDYADTELKQYWMPDSVSKECYECCEKFTTFRRRHHCRVCGQIFCSQCCNQQIPGKIFGCTGDLRVCTYCCKIVLSYLQSSNFGANLSADLKALQENLLSKFGDSPSSLLPNETSPSSGLSASEGAESIRRKISVGYQEETFASDSASSVTYLTNEERSKALQNSTSLRNLYEEICKPATGINFTAHKYRLRTYPDCFLGSELVDWLICQQKAKTRVQAAALAQALLEGTYIEQFTELDSFVDGYVRYRKGNLFLGDSYVQQQRSSNFELSMQEEPSWVQQIPHESGNTDSDNEQMSPPLQGISSSNSYKLNLNLEASSVYLSRPPDSPNQTEEEQSKQFKHQETDVVRPSEKRELAPESGWFNASTLREENGEKEAYGLLSEAYEQHEQSLLKQLLSAKGLSPSWAEVLIPLTHDIVNVIRPDKNHDATELDIRYYAKVKKLPGGSKGDTCVVNGIVCSKNVAHKDMSVNIENPRILLLECSIVYQRTEGRLMSLEPVLMQEQEYLRHTVARIAALRPDIVLVQRNISRLAQDMLRQHKITLVHNVKRSVLERVARCTEADIVGSADAHIGRPKLGTCKRFCLKSFNIDKGTPKTLMFFDGLVAPHLGGTILLRGASKSELTRVKKVALFLIFTAYNWRLEKSFLMDEFALPPNSRMEFLDESRETSPQGTKLKKLTDALEVSLKSSEHEKHTLPDKKSTPKQLDSFSDPLQSVESKKIVSSFVEDNSDPLQSSNEVAENLPTETLTVAKLPFSNDFKKHLDDTILCISPYIIFPMPYLETDAGRRCQLRRFFFRDMYYSEQFEPSTKNKWKNVVIEVEKEEESNKKNSTPLHPFLNAKITNVEDNNVQNMLAHFRACGGQFPKKETLNAEPTIPDEQADEPHVDKVLPDVMDPMNHQRLAVLFYSFSHESNNAPAFCVNPWVVYMDFYGKNDIPLGCFLERYCFRPTYACPSKTCSTPMVKHVRRFVHNSGSVTVSLNNFENEYAEEDIVMWSWCTKCTSVSPVVPLSADSWSYSFAKYLELRFHGEIFNRRGQTPCTHSLHHDHFHYFGYKSYVASFKYSPISIWEISLPPSTIELFYDLQIDHEALIEEGKSLALKGHELFALILDKISVFPGEELEGVGNVRQVLTNKQASFRQKVEEVQLKLTSPTVENKEFNEANVLQAYWKIKDNVTRIKMSLAELCDTWNMHLSEAIKKSDKKKDKSSLAEPDSPANEANEKSLADAQKDVAEIEKGDSLEESSLRRHSDGATVPSHIEESSDNRKEVVKKEKSVKNILDKLLPSSGQLNPIQSPFPPEEHYNLPQGVYGPISVIESELSSIIAYALNSNDYKEFMAKKSIGSDQSPSPLTRRKINNDKTSEEEKSGLLGFLRNKDSKTDLSTSAGIATGNESGESDPSATPDKVDDQKKIKDSHIEIQFQNSTCNFYCRIYLADKFAQLRSFVLPGGEEAYIRSLSRSFQWKAVGGKSGSSFAKTLDDRFILKEMPRAEVDTFLESSSNYFAYMQKCYGTMQPTLLGKIVGIYQTIYKNSANVPHRSCLLVMENLFYNRDVSQKFDLKGSVRNRLVVPDNREGEVVWLDENLLKMTCDNPLYVLPHSKEVLLAAIHNDTEFLSTQSVMDYSLLVGLDSKNRELVLGIIDYIRTFTWDKKLETIVKKTGILGGQGKLPTIISPEEYQKRFIEAMHRYFLEVPDHYAGMGKGLDV